MGPIENEQDVLATSRSNIKSPDNLNSFIGQVGNDSKPKGDQGLFPPINRRAPIRWTHKEGNARPNKIARQDCAVKPRIFKKYAPIRDIDSKNDVINDSKLQARKHWARLRGIFAPKKTLETLVLEAFLKKRLEGLPEGATHSEYKLSLEILTIQPGSALRHIFSCILIIAFIWNFYVVIFE